MSAHPPGPGLPLQAPSVTNRTSSAGGAASDPIGKILPERARGETRGCRGGGPLRPASVSVLSDDAHQDAQDIDAIAEDRLHRPVGRLQPDPVPLAVEPFQRRLAVLVPDRDDL